MVCIFLYGGNDYANTVTPYDTPATTPTRPCGPASRTRAARSPPPRSVPPWRPSIRPAWPTSMRWRRTGALLPLFDGGQLGVLLNVGTLVQPTTKPQYTNNSVKLPPKLFSHNDQQSVWQSSMPEGALSGWGGRMGDLFESGNGNATFTCVNVSGNAVFMSGASAVQYQISTNGSVPLAGLKSPLFGSSAASDALRTLITQPRTPFAGSGIQPGRQALHRRRQRADRRPGRDPAHRHRLPHRQQPGRPAQDGGAHDRRRAPAGRQAPGVLRLAGRLRPARQHGHLPPHPDEKPGQCAWPRSIRARWNWAWPTR